MTGDLSRLSAALADRYRIERELGHGGMATVYLAEDLKHKRKVALKVLKPELAAVLGAERFVQEITTTAALQHPHILPLFDSGSADGFLYYVMPYVEGETLREKLNRETQLGIDEGVKIACDVADALDYAHRHGVIHRDIKPENILLHDGRPMVADFGIALALSAAAGGRMTETGLSLGTPHYMSPEQATAEKEITARSDVYSLASVLYEMLTGSPPHVGASAQQIIMKIVTEDAVPVTALRKSVPTNVAAALTVALERLPADRFESAARFAEALRNPAFALSSGATRVALGASGWRARAALPLLVVSGLLLATTVWLVRRPIPAEPAVGRFEIPLEGGMGQGGLAISPDGRAFLYQVPNQGLIVRRRSDLQGKLLTGATSGGSWAPAVSPDGRSVAFETGFPGSLKVVPIGGGAARVVVPDSTSGYGTAWGPDGAIYYSSARGALMRVPAEGGAPVTVAVPDTTKGYRVFLMPDLLPGGRAALVSIFGAERPRVGIVEFGSGAVTILSEGTIARFGAPDYVIVGRETGALVAIPFDASRRVATGPELALGDTMRAGWGGTIPSLSLSRTGDLAYLAGSMNLSTLVRVDRSGRAQPVDPDWKKELFSGIALSPDGRRVAVSKYMDGRDEIWLKTLDRGPLVRLSFGGILSYRPAWSPDGQSIMFVSDRDPGHPPGLYRVSATGGGEAELIFRTAAAVDEAEWSRDGRWIVYRAGSGGARDIYAVRPGMTDAPIPVATSQFEERSPALSPDGRFIAYVSDESGQPEVYVRPFPDAAAARWAVSTRGGSEPRWSHSGRELFYRDGAGTLVAAEVAPGPGFAVSEERLLFSTRAYQTEGMHHIYDVLPDDQGFLFARMGGEEKGRMVVIENWRRAVQERRGR